MLILIALGIISIQAVLALLIFQQHRAQKTMLYLIATAQHTQALDVALYYYKLPAARAVDYARSTVDSAARAAMQKKHGAGYQDWLRAQYERMQSTAVQATRK